MKYNRFDNNSFNNSFNNRFRDSIPTPPSFYRKQMNTPQKPQKKNRFIPEIKDNIGIDKQATQLAKLFYNSQQYFIKKCKYRNQIGFLYKSTFNYWAPLQIKTNRNLQRHFSQVLFALSKELRVMRVVKGRKLIHYNLPKKNDIILCKYILRMRNTQDKYVWIPTTVINIDYFGNAEISFNNNYTRRDVYRKTVIRNNEYLTEWKWNR